MRIALITPAPPHSLLGNRQTAVRWARILKTLGARVDILNTWTGGDHDLMVALHAHKSRAAMVAFKQQHPARPLILALTGTDIYRDIRAIPAAADSLDLAERIVVLQAEALDELTPEHRAKAHVIIQSEVARGTWQPPRRFFRFCVLGHLRAEKDPFRAAWALQRIAMPQLRLEHAGAALTPDCASAAFDLMQAEPRYRWHQKLTHGSTLRLLRHSHVLIVSSLLEGGAHVVSEAIVHGIPVLATDIPGNRGLLGGDYPGYFPVQDTDGLARQMRTVATDADYLRKLAQASMRRQPLFTPEHEQSVWRKLLDGLP